MKSLFGALLCALAFFATSAPLGAAGAPPPPEGTIYNTTFVEVTPSAAGKAMAMLKEYRDAARKEPGAVLVDIYQEAGTPARFVSNEVWKDWAAYDEHAKAPPRTELFAKLKPIAFGPPDARTHSAHFIFSDSAKPAANSVFIISHLDVTPPAVPKLLELMQPLAAGSAKENGAVTYEIMRQYPGTNHFRLFEVWANEADWVRHNAAAHTQSFRDDVAPLLGTPYDQRRYNLVP